MIANHATSTSCISSCKCGADLTNEVHYARTDVDACDKRLIELRNSGVAEDEIQQAQEARQVAQERYDAAFKAFVDFTNNHPMKIAGVDDEEAVMSDEDDISDDDSDSESANTSGMVGGNIDAFAGNEDDDDDDDEDFKPEA